MALDPKSTYGTEHLAKASLVMSYFMHLRHEGAAMKLMVVAAFGVLVIFLFLTFSDYLYR